MSDPATPPPPSAPLTPDLCVIGAGTGGLAFATAAAAFGVAIVIVERDRMGGDVGDAVIEALAAAGARAQAVREARRFGIVAAEPEIDDAQLHDHIQRVLTAQAPNVSAERLTALGATVLRGDARFVSRSTVMVADQAIKARRFVIATGARTAVPAHAGLDGIPHLSVSDLTSLTRRPERLIVLGGQATGVAIAQAMRRLGSQVALVDEGDLLRREDPEAVAILRRTLLREGVALHEHTTIERAERAKGGVRLVIGDGASGSERTIEGTHLLLAGPAQPAIDGLDLELAGIRRGPDGIQVDRGLRCTNRRVYAIGDCAGGAPGSVGGGHVAEEQARLVLRNALFRQPGAFAPLAAPQATRTFPAIARVGLSEADALANGPVRILRWPYAESARAHAERTTDGFVKLVTDAKGKLLGASIVGAQADELIATIGLALKREMSVAELAELLAPWPSLSEVSKRAAASFLVPLATKPLLRRIIGILRRFG